MVGKNTQRACVVETVTVKMMVNVRASLVGEETDAVFDAVLTPAVLWVFAKTALANVLQSEEGAIVVN